ncbi:hypothetical protein JRO89_XS12G0018300 [Xanthoceras sorbifolium]|uniref:Glycosyltransferase N-terminal domain-containing protein n=1 Tax=Xanthoceras sorbifolium TaxID=99658 RepID=A0ABQ8HAH3_9ROSI|nr:hypothetical protein JRO89_XS12G0018300 [Xanthoceras sorbifolium]
MSSNHLSLHPPQTAMENQLHFVLFPHLAQGHMIPMIDIGRMLARRGVIITVVTTPHNAARFEKTLARAIDSGLQIRLIQLQLPWAAAGLPEGCENLDLMPSLDSAVNLFTAAAMLQEPVEKLFQELKPQPNCIISDVCAPYTAHIASKFNIPRIAFNGTGCFCLLCLHNSQVSNVLERITSESEYFVISGLPDKVEFTKPQIDAMPPQLKAFGEKMHEANLATYGVIVNSFEELEPAYVQEYSKVKDGKVWCIGPVSLYNKDCLDKAQRGKMASIDQCQILKWLDSQDLSSVLYACLGSLCNMIPTQLIELGLGLEASGRPFIWVIRKGDNSEELQKWAMENGFEERTKGRGLVIWGWAPQGEEEKVGVMVKREGVKTAVEKLMDGEEMEAQERRERARELGKLASTAVEEGGSSYLNIELLLQDIMNQGINSELEYFVIPGLPDKVEITKQQIDVMPPQLKEFGEKMHEADLATYRLIVNSFEELEPTFVKEYSKLKDGKVWCIGPVSVYNKDYLDKAERDASSVFYACLGSFCNIIPAQLIELGLGLEASEKPFIWVIRKGDNSKELKKKKWAVETDFEDRTKGIGFVIWGWAPQVLILSHPAIGGFLTHSGYNSSLEGICAGLPLLTWPLFGYQFLNEKLVVQIVKTGVRIGVENPIPWGEEEKVGVLVKREHVKTAVEKLMDEEEKEAQERRERARELGKLANIAVKEGGLLSSTLNFYFKIL